MIILLAATPVSAKVFVTHDGTYVGGLPEFYTDGAMVKGTPSVDKDGNYLDGTVKQAAKSQVWKKIKDAIELKLAPPPEAKSEE